MAGYFIYSFNWEMFQQFISQPNDDQLKKFLEALDDGYEDRLDAFEEYEEDDATAKSWSSEGEDPASTVVEHLKRSDWYTGLGQNTCGVWSQAIARMAEGFDFRVDSDGIYWNLIELATKKLGEKSDKQAVARFGRCPYSVTAIEPFEPKSWGQAWWDPYHSMHPPEEVKRLVDEIESLKDDVISSNDGQAIDDFEELMPALASILKDNRVLYVCVDT